MTAREVIRRWVGDEVSEDEDPDYCLYLADDLLAALAAAGCHVVGEGQGVVGGEVVRLTRRTRLGGHYGSPPFPGEAQ